jgi:hypothetical protein
MAAPKRKANAKPANPSGARILVVEARFYNDIADALLAGAAKALDEAKASWDNIVVPGALEIAPAIAIALDSAEKQKKPYDGVVALGCVIQGETFHFDIVAMQSTRTILDMSVARRIPIGNGILTVDTEAQQTSPFAQSAALRIVVIAGEDAVNVIQQRTATAPVVEVRDANNQPVARRNRRALVMVSVFALAALVGVGALAAFAGSSDGAGHRPWPPPSGPWLMAQRWHDLLFAHWPIAPEALCGTLPGALEPDTFLGTAWLGVIPFRMSRVRLRGTVALPWLSAFPELNVRTYVTFRGCPGVWFLSLDAARWVAVAAARAWFRLPYFHARMRCSRVGEDVVYASVRTHARAPGAEFYARYSPRGDAFRARPGTLEHWLTERYRLYALSQRGKVLSVDIDHQPWALQPAAAVLERNTMARAHGIELPTGAPLLHFARRQDVRVWPPRTHQATSPQTT